MRILSLSIRNYKCHKSVDRVPFHDLTTIIGENDSGKTALIDFLEIMLTGVLPKPDDFHRSIQCDGAGGVDREIVEEEICGEIVFELDDNEKAALPGLLDEKQYLRLKRAFSKNNDVTCVFARKFGDQRLHSYESLGAGDLKDLLSSLGLEDQRNQELRKTAILDYIEQGSPASSFDWVEIPYTKVKPHLPKLIRYNVDDYKNPSSMIYKVLQEVFENELYLKREDGTKELKNQTLNEVLGQVRAKVADAAQQFKKHVQRYNDKIIDITIEPDIDLSTGLRSSPIKVMDETGLFTYLDSRGFGTKKRMFMAIFEWNKEVVVGIGQGYTVRCYDEPDNSLHIDAQRKLYKTVKAIVDGSEGKSQVVVCTHSLFMIDAAPAYSINLVKRNDGGSTSIEYLDTFGDESVQRFLEVMCREMGLPNSHIFFEKCFIVLEGQTEANFLPLAYRKLYRSVMSEDGITLVNLDGNYSVPRKLDRGIC